MARSQGRTTVSVLRGILGSISGQERRFAKLVRRSPSWVKKVSAGIIPLTPEMARVLSNETGVSFQWLLGTASRKPVSAPHSAELYTRDYFEWYRAKRNIGHSVAQSAYSPADFFPLIISIGFAAGAKRKASLFIWRLKSFLSQQADEFGADAHAAKIANLLLAHEGRVTVEPGSYPLRIGDLWIFDRDPRGLRFNLGTPAAQRLARAGAKKIRIKSPKIDAVTLALTSTELFKSAKKRR